MDRDLVHQLLPQHLPLSSLQEAQEQAEHLLTQQNQYQQVQQQLLGDLR